MKKKVLFRGPALTQSGYGVHSRQVISWLLSRDDIELYIQVLPWGGTPWYTNPSALNGLIGQIMERTKPFNSKFDVTFQLQLPNEWDPKLGEINIGITAGVETDMCNPQWAEACGAMTTIVVPSEHTKRSLTSNQTILTPILVIPEAFPDSVFNARNNNLSLDLGVKTSFNFLMFGQLTGNNQLNDRKNTFLTLKWLFEAFKDDEDVGIILKTNAGTNSKIDRNNVTDIIRSVINETRQSAFPKVYLLHGDMSDDEVSQLYRRNDVKALVTLTRGEGFGLPILEAAASDLPVIATSWSAHTEFLNKGKYIPVYYTLENVHESRIDNKIFMKGSRWANASESDFKKKVTKFRNSSTIPKEWAIELGSKIRDEYSLEKISKLYENTFNQILKANV